MHPVRKKKLIKLLVPALVLTMIVGLVLYALRQNISLFYTPTEILADKAPKGALIRVGGQVVPQSITRGEGLTIQFDLTDTNKTLHVSYQGLLPDLFREGQGLVVEGENLGSGQFQAHQVLAKHDENYMPPEVKEALAKGAREAEEARA